MNLESSLNNIIEYRYSDKGNREYIHIGYGIDDNYARCMATSIVSFCINNVDKYIVFHVITSGLSNNTKEKLKALAQKYSLDLIIYEINIELFKTLPIKDCISLATYFRFILPLILNNIDVLFYVDADIVCLREATKLLKVNLEENIVAAVPDLDKMNKRNKVLGLNKHIYFNAGLIVINIKKWNEYDVSRLAIKMISENPRLFLYQDQDALNKLLTGKVKYLDRCFNCIDVYSIKQNEIVLLHFANNPKPWSEKWYINRMYNDFTKNLYNVYENKTPWKGTKLEKINNKKVLIKAYIKYILYKIIKYI